VIVKTLVDDISNSKLFDKEHGLSLYIETKHHKILFDTGSSGLFADNAKKMGVDLSKVDLVFISHGHYDHCGGLKTFLGLNNNAKIYINKIALGEFYSHRSNGEIKYIGIDKELISHNQFILVDDHLIIDDELELFSNVKGSKFCPSANKHLLVKKDGAYIGDDFAHEQNLIIKENNKIVLIVGCAHKGIINILEHYYANNENNLDYIIGGFHLFNHSSGVYEDSNVISEIGSYLLGTKAKFYTCHCTGITAYEELKQIMGDNVFYLSTGNEIKI